jgi:hypothetical protein
MTSANPERIEVIHSTENLIDTYFLAKSRWDYFADVKSLALPFPIESISEASSSASSTGIKLTLQKLIFLNAKRW